MQLPVYPFMHKDPADPAVIATVVAACAIAPSSVVDIQPWLVRALLRTTARGPLDLCQLCVEPLVGAAEVNSVVLHRIPVRAIRDQAEAYLLTSKWRTEILAKVGGKPPSKEEQHWARRVARAAARQPLRRGRHGYPLDHYRAVAFDALEIHRAGNSDVTKRLADRHGIPYQTARDWIRKAREHGFLGPTQRGRSQWTEGSNLYRKE